MTSDVCRGALFLAELCTSNVLELRIMMPGVRLQCHQQCQKTAKHAVAGVKVEVPMRSWGAGRWSAGDPGIDDVNSGKFYLSGSS